MRKHPQRHVDSISWRMRALSVFILLSALGLGYRLSVIEVADHAHLTAEAASHTATGSPTPPTRGVIYDDAGNQLALDDDVYYVDVAPYQVVQPVREARAIAPRLGLKLKPLEKLLKTNRAYARLGGPIPQTQFSKWSRLREKWPGISLDPAANRVYPEGSLAAQVLGFVNSNGGQYGLEQKYNRLLAGRANASRLGIISSHADGVIRDASTSVDSALRNGATLHLSIDTAIQDVVEQDLKQAVVDNGAKGGTAIIMNPHTGRVIAMASYPTFNPNSPTKSPATNWSNPAISYTYEPGSTFKIITMAAGLNTHVITPNTQIDDPGYRTFPLPGGSSITIHNWNYPVANGPETMTQVLQHSANVGASFVASLLGPRRFYPYVRSFGVGTKTGIDLQGESSGMVPLPNQPHKIWYPGNLYTNSFGQALSVTPLQLLTAVNAVANRGWMMRPEIVRRIDYDGRSYTQVPHREHRVISAESASTLTHMLVTSAVDGEAEFALVPGYNIAAKTGTASIPGPEGAYLEGSGSTIASTVAYAPAFHPRFSVLVVIRQPTSQPWGSTVAAPVVSNLLQSLFLHYHIQPTAHPAQATDQ